MGARLRVLRAVRHYTQARLSQLSGLSRQYLSELEQGKRLRPRGPTLERLADALEVTVEELRGKAALGAATETTTDDPVGPDGPPPADEPDACGAAAHGVFALTGTIPEAVATVRAVADVLAEMPAGVVVMQRHYADGSVLLYIALPPGAVKPPG